MKRKTLLLVVFLMCLYIVPSILAPMYDGSAILTEQNTTKDFALSTEYETSNQSITSFSETLPDDVLYYPDSFIDNTIHLAEDGSADWIESQVVDSTYWYATDGDAEISLWNTSSLPVGTINGFKYAFYGYAEVGTCELYYTGTVETETIASIAVSAISWYNGTYYPDPSNIDTVNDAIHNIGIDSGVGETIKCDYLQIQHIYMTV